MLHLGRARVMFHEASRGRMLQGLRIGLSLPRPITTASDARPTHFLEVELFETYISHSFLLRVAAVSGSIWLRDRYHLMGSLRSVLATDPLLKSLRRLRAAHTLEFQHVKNSTLGRPPVRRPGMTTLPQSWEHYRCRWYREAAYCGGKC